MGGQSVQHRFKGSAGLVAVEGDDVAAFQHDGVHGVVDGAMGSVVLPHAGRQRLRRVDLARPVEDADQQLGGGSRFLVSRTAGDGLPVDLIGFVEQVPREDAGVFGKSSQHRGHVGLESGPAGAVVQHRAARALHPYRVVQPRDRIRLDAELRRRVPDPVEEHRNHADPVPVGDGQHTIDTIEERVPVGFEEQVVQVDADDVHAEIGRPSQLPVDGLRVEGLVLPHLELIARRRGREVAAHKPAQVGLPARRALVRPSLCCHVSSRFPCGGQSCS